MHYLLTVALSALLMSIIDAQLVFYPNLGRTRFAMLGTPDLGWSRSKQDTTGLASQEFGVAYGDAEGRGNFRHSDNRAEETKTRQRDELLATAGGQTGFRAIPSPLLTLRIELQHPPRAVTIVVHPVCVACKCQVGFKSCAAAGGRVWVNKFCFTGLTAFPSTGDECSFPAPSSLSACETLCVKSCTVKPTTGGVPALADCTPLDGYQRRSCGAPCENVPTDTIVKCNSAFPDAISSIPRPCNNQRYRRDVSNSLPVNETVADMPRFSHPAKARLIAAVALSNLTSTRSPLIREPITIRSPASFGDA